MLVGEGAEQFARTQGMDLVPNDRLVCPRMEGGHRGGIVVTPEDAAYAFTTPRMARGWCAGDDTSNVAV
jgi:isoaspartyl peptidase/L-asparaginase-like protein (Ntn-hydrolase superfamily)